MALSTEATLQTPPSSPPKNGSPTVKSHSPVTVAGFSARGSSPLSKVRQVRQKLEDEGSDSEAITGKKTSSASIPENLFETEYSRIMFKAVDRLQSLYTLGDCLSMPQLVIVGGQSAGKSSLLKTLTGIPFPVDTGCCTRFPTRIVSTRTAPGTADSYRISIDRSPITVEGIAPAPKGYEKYQRTGVTLTLDHFEEIMKEVSQQLGIRRGLEADKRNFASEVLKIELDGPHRTQYSILDLPGQFTKAREVKQEDAAKITDMIVQYVQQPENIVVCVVDAPTDLTHQSILDLVNENAAKERTIGVFTKCDMIENDLEMAQKVVNIAKNRSEHEALKLPSGWFFVRNQLARDPDGLNLEDEEEKLFSKRPWTEVNEDRRGSKALMNHLSRVLDSKIRDRFPHLRDRITKELLTSQYESDKLGPIRNSHAARQQYVGHIAQSFENQVDQSLRRNGYQSEKMQILSMERKLEKGFDTVMREYGMVWKFQEDGRYDIAEGIIRPPSTAPPLMNNLINSSEVYAAYSKIPQVQTTETLLTTIKMELDKFQANQLPTIINPDVFHKMYLEQVKNWRQIVHVYLQQVRVAVLHCIEAILREVCPDKDGTRKLHERLAKLLRGYFEEAVKTMVEDCEHQCRKEMSCEKLHPSRGTEAFEKVLKKRQEIRWLEVFQSLDWEINNPLKIARDSLEKAHWSVGDNMVFEVHDVVKGYYEASLETFIDNIDRDVSMFVSGENSPLRRLNYNTIMNLSEEEISLLGSEDDFTLRKRELLNGDIQKWTEALQIVDEATQQTTELERT